MIKNSEYLFRINYLKLFFRQMPGKKIALWGAGEHTRLLLSDVLSKEDRKRLTVIIDDNSSLKKLKGIPVSKPESVKGIDAVFISSDAWETKLKKRAEELFKKKVPVFCPYEKIGKGPFAVPDLNVVSVQEACSEKTPDELIDERLAKVKFPTKTRKNPSEDKNISFAKVEQYNRYMELFPELCFHTGDTKNVERGWIAETILSQIPKGGRLLEIGGDCCLVADFLQRRGYEVWNVDPYINYGGGAGKYEEIKKRFPNIKIIRGFLKDMELPGKYFDAVYSISVLEHVSVDEVKDTFSKCRYVMKKNGLSIHAVDYCIEGPGGFMENHD